MTSDQRPEPAAADRFMAGEATPRPKARLRLGTTLAEMSRRIGLSNADVEALEQLCKADPAQPLRPA